MKKINFKNIKIEGGYCESKTYSWSYKAVANIGREESK